MIRVLLQVTAEKKDVTLPRDSNYALDVRWGQSTAKPSLTRPRHGLLSAFGGRFQLTLLC